MAGCHAQHQRPAVAKKKQQDVVIVVNSVPARHQSCQHEELEQLANRVFVDPRQHNGVGGRW
jgi:hypothetical protein